MPRKPAHQQADTAALWSDAAFRLFGRYGYDGVSLDDIANEIHLSKSALYWHYDNKQALYLACLKRAYQLFDDYIFDTMSKEQNALNRMQYLFAGAFQLLTDDNVRAGMMGYWTRGADMPTPIRDQMLAFENKVTMLFKETIRLGKEQGHFDFAEESDDMATAITVLLEGCLLALPSHSNQTILLSLNTLARTLLRAYARSEAAMALFSR